MAIAVLMSSYNGEKYIEEQIESILAQQCEIPIELFVRDDGSTDSTREILQKYALQGKLRWYSGENLKPAKSFLELVKHCPGYDYYAFADQDDYWYPNKLQSGILALEKLQGPGLYFANVQLVDGALQSLGRNAYRQPPKCDFYSLVVGSNVLGCTCVFNGELASLVQRTETPDKIIMHDSYLAILCTLFGGTVVYDPQAQMDYRQHGNNVVGTNWNKWSALKDRIRRVTKRQKVSIADQAESILAVCSAALDKDKLDFLRKVASYRDSVYKAAALACSNKPKYNGKNMEITIRLATLLRNQ